MAVPLLRTLPLRTIGTLTLLGPTTYIYTAPSSHTLHAESAVPTTSFKSFVSLPLHSSEDVTHNVKRLRFLLPTEDTVVDIPPITALLAYYWKRGDWTPTLRPYTPVSSNDSPDTQSIGPGPDSTSTATWDSKSSSTSPPGTIDFLVKKYPNGRMSRYLHELVPGDTVSFRRLPAREFEYESGQYRHVLAIAGGTGITPIWQLARHILRDPKDETKLSLIYAAESESDLLLRWEIDELVRKHPDRFQVLYTVRRGTKSPGVESGYVTEGMIRRFLPQDRNGVKVLVSGPEAMVLSLAGAMGTAGFTQGKLGGVLGEMGLRAEDVRKLGYASVRTK